MRFTTCLLVLLSVALAYQCANAQIFDKLTEKQNQPSEDRQQNNRGLGRLTSVNVPMFYDMVRNGSSLGLNVLSGLVKVERGDEAERNGLMGNGRRPLSVRIFGVPVFERGVRVRPPPGSSVPSRPKEVESDGDDSSMEPLADVQSI